MLEVEEKIQLRFEIRAFCYKMQLKVTLLFKFGMVYFVWLSDKKTVASNILLLTIYFVILSNSE